MLGYVLGSKGYFSLDAFAQNKVATLAGALIILCTHSIVYLNMLMDMSFMYWIPVVATFVLFALSRLSMPFLISSLLYVAIAKWSVKPLKNAHSRILALLSYEIAQRCSTGMMYFMRWFFFNKQRAPRDINSARTGSAKDRFRHGDVILSILNTVFHTTVVVLVTFPILYIVFSLLFFFLAPAASADRVGDGAEDAHNDEQRKCTVSH